MPRWVAPAPQTILHKIRSIGVSLEEGAPRLSDSYSADTPKAEGALEDEATVWLFPPNTIEGKGFGPPLV
jgi:hypothetical protein